VHAFAEIFGAEKLAALQAAGCRALCLGAETAAAAQDRGFATVVAAQATIESMVIALCRSVLTVKSTHTALAAAVHIVEHCD
jgi:uroporphyrinogen-III synthase